MSAAENQAVFLSYASQDAAAARRICEALRAAGVEVWFDQSELVGGDAWDAKIRKQIKECALFVPVISANTQARLEGYFRLEWKLAAQRTHTMADAKPFLVPLCIDDTRDTEAHVPEEFRAVQWTRLASGDTGARFCTRVQNLLADSSGTGSPTARAVMGTEVPATSTPRARREDNRATRKPRRWSLAGAAVVVLGLAALAIFLPGRKQVPEKSIAVLPFENLGGDRENEIFSDGVSDELLNVLGKVPGLLVKGRQSSFAFKGRNVPEDEIARTLGVGYIVNGTVQRSGSQVRILARLNRAADGNQIWSEGFTEEAKDIFSVQDRIAGLIAQNLQLKLGAAAKPKRAVNPEAHRLTLEGRHFWTLRTDEGFQRAESAYLKALEIDPDFAEAHAGLADVWAVRGWYDVLAGIDVTSHFARAREQAQLALRIDDTLAGPWAALGAVNYNEWMFVEAERAFQNALRLNPNYSYAHHWRAHLLMVQGRLDEALRELDTATRLDPLSLATLVIYASQLQYAGRYAEALEMCDRAAAFTPYVFVPLQATRAYGLLMLGRRNEALTTARLAARDITVKPRWWNDALVVFVLRACGQSAEAEELTNRLLSGMDANNRGRATLLAAAGRTEEALAEFARLKPGASAMGVVYYSEICESLRKHPRFLDTLAKLDSLADYHVAQATLARMKGARK